MSDRESDIEFDFFEESDTRESAEERPRRRGPRPPVRPPTGLTPLLRLVGLISFAILIVLLLILWVNGCREDQRKDTYRDYVENVAEYAKSSGDLGRQFNTLLTTRGTKQSDVENELSGLADSQNQIATRARELEVPGRLRAQHAHMLDSFDLRFEGLKGMTDAFKSTAASTNANQAGPLLAQQMKRFVASDVIWEDLFKDPTIRELQNLSITGVNVPDSTFLPNSDIATTASMKAVWQRIHGTETGDPTCTPRGTGIVSTKVLPSGRELSADETNTIQASTDLGFAVLVENSGCAQEVGLKVRLTIQQTQPITKQATIALLNSGDETTVEFRDITLPRFDQRTSLTIEVDPVPQEQSVDNNTASYPVQFSVG
jgi:CARDB